MSEADVIERINQRFNRPRPVIHREHTAPQWQDAGRRRLRSGAARVALDIKRRGFQAPGLRAEAMAQAHSERTLERMAAGGGSVARVGMTVDPTHPKASTWP